MFCRSPYHLKTTAIVHLATVFVVHCTTYNYDKCSSNTGVFSFKLPPITTTSVHLVRVFCRSPYRLKRLQLYTWFRWIVVHLTAYNDYICTPGSGDLSCTLPPKTTTCTPGPGILSFTLSTKTTRCIWLRCQQLPDTTEIYSLSHFGFIFIHRGWCSSFALRCHLPETQPKTQTYKDRDV